MQRWITLLLTLLLTLTLTSIAFAQASIEVGDSVEDEADGDTVEYEIELEEGDEIEITLQSDDFDTLVGIFNEDGDQLDANDDGPGMGLNSFLEFEAEEDGIYIIVVDAYDGGPEGDYELTVEEAGTADDNQVVDFDGDWGRDVECSNGDTIEDGVELVVVEQRSGNQYRFTAVGIDGFDPIIAVSLEGDFDDANCSDDDDTATAYEADLPTTGQVDSSDLSSQVIFNLNSANPFEDVSIVVGSADGSSGEFILIIEGMFASELDNAGDAMSLNLSPALLASDVDPTVYMLSVSNALNPFIYLVDDSFQQVEDENGDEINCETAGDSDACWGVSTNLEDLFVSRSDDRVLDGGDSDAMMTIAIDEGFFNTDDIIGGWFNYAMTSDDNSEGEYLVVLHLAVEAEE